MEPLSAAMIRKMLAAAAVEQLPSLISRHEDDRRAGVIQAVAQARTRMIRTGEEHARLISLAALECRLADEGLALVAGVDEVGRGALAGPVSAGACIFARDAMILGLNDSKALSALARERLAATIASVAVAWAVGHAEAAEIDALGIGPATVLAMRRAIRALPVTPAHVLVDGRPVDIGLPATAIVRGDATVRAIAAAAILAKVTRDALMVELDAAHPGYGLAGNKGYGSPDHLAALGTLGPSAIHRRSFSPCSQTSLF